MEAPYRIDALTKDHNKKEFSCGSDPLDHYLRAQAGQDERRRISTTYVLTARDANLVIGYYTLSASSIDLSALPEALRKKLPRYPAIPATLLGRLAVDKNYQGKNLGEHLLIDALRRSLDISGSVASMAVIVHAKNEPAIRFYMHYGFIPFLDMPNKLFLPIETIEKLLT